MLRLGVVLTASQFIRDNPLAISISAESADRGGVEYLADRKWARSELLRTEAEDWGIPRNSGNLDLALQELALNQTFLRRIPATRETGHCRRAGDAGISPEGCINGPLCFPANR